MNNGKFSLTLWFATFRMTPMRKNIWDAIFVFSLLCVLYYMWKGPTSAMLSHVFIATMVWYGKRLELEISNRNQGKK